MQAPSEAIDGVPEEFDELVLRATSRDPDARYADAAQFGAELDAISSELRLPPFRVPAPATPNSMSPSSCTAAG